MNIRKLICLALALVMVLALVSCTKGGFDDALDKTLNGGDKDDGKDDGDYDFTKFSEGLDDNGHYKGAKALDYVTLPDFDSVKIPEFPKNKDGAVADGDVVNIDYVGSMDGVEFEGGSTGGKGYDIVVGKTSFIDDFIEQIKGHAPGENFDIEVTFPDPYQNNPDFAGKDAVFNITVNYIWGITDESAQALGFKDKDEMGQYVAYSGYSVEELIADPEVGVFLSAAKCDKVPESVVETVRNLMTEEITIQSSQYNMDADTFIQYVYGAPSFEEYLDVQAESEAKWYLILQAVAERENITVTDEAIAEREYDEYVETYGRPYVAYTVMQEMVRELIEEKLGK